MNSSITLDHKDSLFKFPVPWSEHKGVHLPGGNGQQHQDNELEVSSGTRAPGAAIQLSQLQELNERASVPLWIGDAPPTPTLRTPTASFPLVVRAEARPATTSNSIDDSGSLQVWATAASKLIDQLLPTSEGALLFKGLPIRTPRQFRDFADNLGWHRVQYEPVAGKRQQVEGIDAATNIPAAAVLPVHNEMSYNPRPASRIAFFCVAAAVDGGESLLAKNSDLTSVLQKAHPDYMERFERHGGITYKRQYGDKAAMATLAASPDRAGGSPRWVTSWQDRTGTDDRSVAERFWRDTMGFDTVRWDDAGTMHLAWTCPVLRPVTDVDETGSISSRSVWFNSIDFGTSTGQSWSITYADDQPIEQEVVDAVRTLRWLSTYALKLEAGDWLVLDNLRVQHGRLPFLGNERQLMVIMS